MLVKKGDSMKTIKLLLCLSMFLFLHPALASTLRGEDSYWQCKTVDMDKKEWVAKSSYKKKALNDSYAQCKKISKMPSSCQTSYNQCSMTVKGQQLMPRWQCTALDKLGKKYESDFFNSRNNAIEGAKMLCRKLSSSPNKCYVRTSMCKNRTL